MFEKNYDFWELFLIDYRILFKKKNGGNFEDNFSAKIEVDDWIKNMAAASYLPRISRPKCGKP